MQHPALPATSTSLSLLSIQQHIAQAIAQQSRQADTLMLVLIYALALLSLPVGWHYSSLSLPMALGGLLAATASAIYTLGRGTAWCRYAMPLLMCSGTALLIQVSLGTLEFHFGVFVSLALVMVYREWRVLLCCAGFFAVHHFLFDRLQAWG